ncbi:MAG: HlyD family efflux transporter periplasmic adaptor subunit [Gammaproteobacteria bacterium]|nr:HlyD family efflux transporter periplasmic adaptor subunit [Gammaproteobacteria bacterium]
MASLPSKSLPSLRAELDIFDGGSDKFGAPTWVIHDPVKEKFFRVGWQEFEIIAHWHIGDPEEICAIINATTTAKIHPKNIEKILEFLAVNELLETGQGGNDDKLYEIYLSSKKSLIQKALQKYLFLQVPLLKPNNILGKMLKYVKLLFNKKTVYLLLFFLIMGLYFIGRQWGEFVGQYNYLFTPQNLFILSVSVMITKFFHELGHAFAAKYYGCSIPTMGIALLVFWPVLYTDTTDTWRLKSRHQRIMVASAGIITEFGIAAIALFWWGLIEDGLLRSILIYIPTVSIVTTLLVNANPLLRYDGYHIVSEILATDNLQSKSSDLATWYFRKKMLGIVYPQPVPCSRFDRKIFLFYAYFSWAYRFTLYLSIATLVYFYFFKLLGLFLMLAEIYLFIVYPVYKEVLTCVMIFKKNRHIPVRAIIAIGFLFGLMILLFVPMRSRIEVPAVISYQQEVKIYTQNAGLIKSISIKQGDFVKKDTILTEQSSNEIDYQINKLNVEISIIQNKLREESGLGQVLGMKQVSVQELTDKETELAGFLAERKKLTILAPYDGEISDLAKYLKENIWIDQNKYLFTIINPTSLYITGYMNEHDIARLGQDLTKIKAKFYFNRLRFSPISADVVSFNKAGNKYLDNKYFSSLYGGELTTFVNKNSESKRTKDQENLILNDSVYQIIALPQTGTKNLPNFSVRGKLYVYGEKVSIISRFWQRAVAVAFREGGF